MLGTFLNHQWKAFWRSKSKGGTIAANILMGFMVLYLLAIAATLGFLVEFWIEKFLPGKDVQTVFNGYIIYYFALDFVLRMQLQELPTLSILPYLHLRIPKSKIVNFLNVRSLFSAFNIFPLFLFIPFSVTYIADVNGGMVSLAYVVAVLSLVIFTNYLALYLKRIGATSIRFSLLLTASIVIFAALEYFNAFSIASLSNTVFQWVTELPSMALLFLVAAIVMYVVNTRYLRHKLYAEELSSGEDQKASTDYPFLDRFGEVGTLAALELKLILRHKRTKTALTMSLLFVFYGFLFYKQEVLSKDNFGTVLFAAIFMTGSGVSIYGQFMFGWQAAHFDGLLVNKTNIRSFLKAKFLLFTIMSTTTTIVISFYAFISWKIILVQLAAYFYNLGVGTVIVLYFATRNYKAIDLSKASGFNYQGVSASQFVLMLPYFLLPYLFYLPFSIAGKPYWGIACVGLMGFAAYLGRNYFIDLLTRQFHQQKYKIAEGFRQPS